MSDYRVATNDGYVWVSKDDLLEAKDKRIAKLEADLNKYITGEWSNAHAVIKRRVEAEEWDAPHRGTETPPGKDAGA